jgi:hypothetical protein
MATLAESFKLYLSDKKFAEELKFLKEKWNLDQNEFPTIRDWFKYEHSFIKNKKIKQKDFDSYNETYSKFKYFVKRNKKKIKLEPESIDEYNNDILSFLYDKHLTKIFANLVDDYLLYGKIKPKQKKVAIMIKKSNPPFVDPREIWLHIAPNARLKDVKEIWNEIRDIQLALYPNIDKKTQSSLNTDTAVKIVKAKNSNKKIDLPSILEELKSIDNLKNGKQKVRNMRYRYSKKLKHLRG